MEKALSCFEIFGFRASDFFLTHNPKGPKRDVSSSQIDYCIGAVAQDYILLGHWEPMGEGNRNYVHVLST